MPAPWLRRCALLAALAMAIAMAWALRAVLRIYRLESAVYHPPHQEPRLPEVLRTLPPPRVPAVRTADGTRLGAWYWPPAQPPGPALLLAHGSLGDRTQLAAQAALLAHAGYGLLLFDWPGHGASAGRVALGAPERQAVHALGAWLAAQPEVDSRRLGALGCSMGAYLLLAAAPEEPLLRALVCEGTPTDLLAVTRHQYRRSAPFGPWAARLAARRAGVDLAATRVLEGLPRIAPRALLFVAGGRDESVPAAMAQTLFAAAAQPKELWDVPQAEHCAALERAPHEYRQRVLGFLDRHLK